MIIFCDGEVVYNYPYILNLMSRVHLKSVFLVMLILMVTRVFIIFECTNYGGMLVVSL